MRNLFFFFLLSSFSQANATDTIYLHANVGSFCHRAVNKLVGKETLFDERIFFCNTVEETLQNAYIKNGYAFIKLYEDPDRAIDYQCAKALRSFQIQSIASILRLNNNIYIYRHKKTTSPITKIASDPHLLKKIQKYIKKRKLLSIEVPGGSDEAAKLLSSKEFDLSTAVAGCSLIGQVFPDLISYDKNIQDYRNNCDVYALIKVSKREIEVDLEYAEKEILSLTAQFQKPLQESPKILIFSKGLFFQKKISDRLPQEPLLPQ